VEILHVILLGIVKYFWRDAVARQNQEGREILRARINSLDVSGLGLSTLQGATLVQHAKSLTGGDFRAVLQIGLLVLYDLLPSCAYNAWLALSHLGPLAFQQEIDDVDVYMVRRHAHSIQTSDVLSLATSFELHRCSTSSNSHVEPTVVQQTKIPRLAPLARTCSSLRSRSPVCNRDV
jgi:hypothetical protein